MVEYSGFSINKTIYVSTLWQESHLSLFHLLVHNILFIMHGQQIYWETTGSITQMCHHWHLYHCL